MSDLQGFGPITFPAHPQREQKSPDHHFNPAQFGNLLSKGGGAAEGAAAAGAEGAAAAGGVESLAALAVL